MFHRCNGLLSVVVPGRHQLPLVTVRSLRLPGEVSPVALKLVVLNPVFTLVLVWEGARQVRVVGILHYGEPNGVLRR